MKNLIISAIVGLAFMAGGFYFGNRLAPVPPKPQAAATTAGTTPAAAAPAPEAINIDTLKKTSEAMMTVNQALQAREEAVNTRERKVKEREDELDAERAALDRTHEKFKTLFAEFQSRLQLVSASQMDQLNKQAELYTSMGTDQSIDLIRAMNDQEMTRLFSVMDTKPLAKLMADWKTKYPADGPRLLHDLNAMAEVLPKEKIALSDDTSTPAATSSDSAAPATDAPAPATDSSAPAPADPNTPAPSSTPSLAPPPDPATPAASPANSAPSLPTPPETSQAPVSTAATN